MANLNAIRCKCIQMFRSVHNVNGRIPWLKRKLDADWISVYNTAKERRKTMTEGEVWNATSKAKSTIEQSIGKEAMFMAGHNKVASRITHTHAKQRHTVSPPYM